MELLSIILAPFVFLFASMLAGATWVWDGIKHVCSICSLVVVSIVSPTMAGAAMIYNDDISRFIHDVAPKVCTAIIDFFSKFSRSAVQGCLSIYSTLIFVSAMFWQGSRRITINAAKLACNLLAGGYFYVHRFFIWLWKHIRKYFARRSPFTEAELADRIHIIDRTYITDSMLKTPQATQRLTVFPDGNHAVTRVGWHRISIGSGHIRRIPTTQDGVDIVPKDGEIGELISTAGFLIDLTRPLIPGRELCEADKGRLLLVQEDKRRQLTQEDPRREGNQGGEGDRGIDGMHRIDGSGGHA